MTKFEIKLGSCLVYKLQQVEKRWGEISPFSIAWYITEFLTKSNIWELTSNMEIIVRKVLKELYDFDWIEGEVKSSWNVIGHLKQNLENERQEWMKKIK